MAAADQILGGKNAWLNIFAEKIIVGVRRHGPVGRQKAAFRANDKLFARVSFGGQLFQRRADAAFAALKAIVDGGVKRIDSALCGEYCRRGVTFVGLAIGLAEIRAHAERRQEQAVGIAKMSLGGCRKLCGVA